MTFNKKGVLILAVVVLVLAILSLFILQKTQLLPSFFNLTGQTVIKLPEPVYQSKVSVEEALKTRRSIREYKNEAISLANISQLLWAAQGITSSHGFRTAPSAGALYPLQVYLVSGNIQDLPLGIYHYQPQKQALEMLIPDDKRSELEKAAHQQNEIKTAAADIIITAVFNKATEKYGSLGQRFVLMEAGHAAENLLLQAVSLKLGSVPLGTFDEVALKKLLNLPKDEEPLYVIPVGKI